MAEEAKTFVAVANMPLQPQLFAAATWGPWLMFVRCWPLV